MYCVKILNLKFEAENIENRNEYDLKRMAFDIFRTYIPTLCVSLDQNERLLFIRKADVDMVRLSDFCLVKF